MIHRREVEIRALIRGLSESLDLGIINVVIYCKDCEIYQNVSVKFLYFLLSLVNAKQIVII